MEVNLDSAFTILTGLDHNPALDELERASVFRTWAEAWYYKGNLDSTQTYYTRAFDLYDTNREDSLAFEMLFKIGITSRRKMTLPGKKRPICTYQELTCPVSSTLKP